jgi:hypothetical protein
MVNLTGNAATWLGNSSNEEKVEIKEKKDKKDYSEDMRNIALSLKKQKEKIENIYNSQSDKNLYDCMINLELVIRQILN